MYECMYVRVHVCMTAGTVCICVCIINKMCTVCFIFLDFVVYVCMRVCMRVNACMIRSLHVCMHLCMYIGMCI
jgi:hypothetical protein